MSVRAIFTRLLPGDAPDVIIECRNCGATVGPETDECPECGASEFCRYVIPQ